MEKDLIKHVAELALIGSTLSCTFQMPPSRKKGLLIKLNTAVNKRLATLPRASNAEYIYIKARLDEFGAKFGWEGSEKHLGTMLSFCVDLINRSEKLFPSAILSTLNLLIDHLEEGNQLYTKSCINSKEAADLWNSIFADKKEVVYDSRS